MQKALQHKEGGQVLLEIRLFGYEYNFTVYIVFGNVFFDLITTEGLYQCNNARIILIALLDSHYIDVGAVRAFNQKAVTGCDEAGRNSVISVDDSRVDIL
jgi:hypothetical protein